MPEVSRQSEFERDAPARTRLCGRRRRSCGRETEGSGWACEAGRREDVSPRAMWRSRAAICTRSAHRHPLSVFRLPSPSTRMSGVVLSCRVCEEVEVRQAEAMAQTEEVRVDVTRCDRVGVPGLVWLTGGLALGLSSPACAEAPGSSERILRGRKVMECVCGL